MTVKSKEGSFLHKIPAAGMLSINVTVGNAQVGGGSLSRENTQLIKTAEIRNFVLGDCSSLLNAPFILYMNIIDVNTASNGTSVLVEFNLGVSSRSYLFEEDADDGGVVQYKIDFRLIAG